MRVFQLAQVAARAEGVRVRALIRRVLGSAMMGLVALLFLLTAVAFGHLAMWHALREGVGWSNALSAAVIGGCDLILAVLLGLAAARSTPSRTETEALAVRQRATEGIAASVSLTAALLAALRAGRRAAQGDPPGQGDPPERG